MGAASSVPAQKRIQDGVDFHGDLAGLSLDRSYLVVYEKETLGDESPSWLDKLHGSSAH